MRRLQLLLGHLFDTLVDLTDRSCHTIEFSLLQTHTVLLLVAFAFAFSVGHHAGDWTESVERLIYVVYLCLRVQWHRDEVGVAIDANERVELSGGDASPTAECCTCTVPWAWESADSWSGGSVRLSLYS